MARNVYFHPLVAVDIQRASDWYALQSHAVAIRFEAAVDAAFDRIEANPFHFAYALGDIELRFAQVVKFPYIVLFQLDFATVRVTGVFHGASDPDSWRNRAWSGT